MLKVVLGDQDCTGLSYGLWVPARGYGQGQGVPRFVPMVGK